jgi:hypothetical protein
VDEEVPLAGGELTAVVRVGDTVRRPLGPQTAAVHALLRHLEAKGFDGAPRVLGIDDRGREILTYVEGDCADPFPAVLRDIDGPQQLGRMVRRYHDAVADHRPPSTSIWLQGPVTQASDQVICHGDLGPWNTVWQSDALVGFIDWDFAEPRRPIDDLAEIAWYVVPLGADRIWRSAGFTAEPDRAARLAALCRGYGRFEAVDVLDAVVVWQRFERDRTIEFARRGFEPWARIAARAGEVERFDADIAWLADAYDTLRHRLHARS